MLPVHHRGIIFWFIIVVLGWSRFYVSGVICWVVVFVRNRVLFGIFWGMGDVFLVWVRVFGFFSSFPG